jgi:flagellar protein FlaG
MLAESITVSGESAASPAPAARSPGNEKAGEGAADKKAEEQPALSQTAEIVADAQKSLDMIQNIDLQFAIHEATGRTMVTVRDESSGKVIREIPSSEVLNLAARLDAMVGVIFDQNV